MPVRPAGRDRQTHRPSIRQGVRGRVCGQVTRRKGKPFLEAQPDADGLPWRLTGAGGETACQYR